MRRKQPLDTQRLRHYLHAFSSEFVHKLTAFTVSDSFLFFYLNHDLNTFSLELYLLYSSLFNYLFFI